MSNALVEFKSNLSRMIKADELALPSNVSSDAFRNAAVIAVQDNPQILSCTQDSVFRSIRSLAASGLVPDGREAALVPFNTRENGNYVKKCQAMPMVFGLVKMARRSGEVSDIRAHIVYQKELDQERFDYVIGDQERLTHNPILFGDRGDPVACYAIAILKDKSIVREFMSAEDIDKVRRAGASQRVKSGNQYKVSDKPVGIWADWWESMWKKTVIRRLCKRLDLSSEDMRHIMDDPDFEGMRDITPRPEPGAFAQKASQARGTPDTRKEQDAAPEPPESPSDPIDGEIMDGTGKHWTDLVDTSEATPMDEGFNDGGKAFKAGTDRTECPQDDNAAAWLRGWDEQKKFAEQEEVE